VQAAVDSATDLNGDNAVIVMVIAKADGSLGGTANQSVEVKGFWNGASYVPYAKPFGLFGCSVTMTGGGAAAAVSVAAGASSPSKTINSRTTTIFVMDLHGGNSSVGVQTYGQYRYLRNEYGTSNTTGIKVVGNNNTVHNGKAEGNSGTGVYISGNGNQVTDTDVFSNGGDGVYATGSSNTIKKLDVGEKNKANGGDGIEIVGASNTVQENDLFSNGTGIRVAGNSNQLTKNVAGASGKANGTGIDIDSGTGNKLKENQMTANTTKQYESSVVNTNQGSNKVNGTTAPGATCAVFPNAGSC
jgi:hypothetical protein